MRKNFRQLIDSHEQLYHSSCSVAAIELLLKLHGKVGRGYRKLQDSYKNKNVGYTPLRGRTIRGLKFGSPVHWTPPFTGLDIYFRQELRANRYPLISMYSREEIVNGIKYIHFHEWIIFAPIGNNFIATSKYFKTTTFADVAASLLKSDHTSTLPYTIL